MPCKESARKLKIQGNKESIKTLSPMKYSHNVARLPGTHLVPISTEEPDPQSVLSCRPFTN